MSDTPRTNAVQAVWEQEGMNSALTFIQLARQLERELAQAVEEGRKTMREEILRGLRSEDDSVQLQAIIASVEAIPLKKEPT